jgi:hypothetical protein
MEKAIHDFYHEGSLAKNIPRDLSLSELNHLERSDIVLIFLIPLPFLHAMKGGKLQLPHRQTRFSVSQKCMNSVWPWIGSHLKYQYSVQLMKP